MTNMLYMNGAISRIKMLAEINEYLSQALDVGRDGAWLARTLVSCAVRLVIL